MDGKKREGTRKEGMGRAKEQKGREGDGVMTR